MMAITTSSSISVKPRSDPDRGMVPFSDRIHVGPGQLGIGDEVQHLQETPKDRPAMCKIWRCSWFSESAYV